MSDGPKIPVKKREWTEELIRQIVRDELLQYMKVVVDLKREGKATPAILPKRITVTKKFDNLNPDRQEEEANAWIKKNDVQNVVIQTTQNPMSPSVNITTVTGSIKQEEEKFD